jgi:hypothetical protein
MQKGKTDPHDLKKGRSGTASEDPKQIPAPAANMGRPEADPEPPTGRSRRASEKPKQIRPPAANMGTPETDPNRIKSGTADRQKPKDRSRSGRRTRK